VTSASCHEKMNSRVEIVTRPRVPRIVSGMARITAFCTAARSVEKRDMMSPIWIFE
jgi:hypothetical protein